MYGELIILELNQLLMGQSSMMDLMDMIMMVISISYQPMELMMMEIVMIISMKMVMESQILANQE